MLRLSVVSIEIAGTEIQWNSVLIWCASKIILCEYILLKKQRKSHIDKKKLHFPDLHDLLQTMIFI